MSKRNFILLMIVLVIATIVIFGFLYSRSDKAPGETTGTNFISRFNPFGSSKPATPPVVINPGAIPEEPTPTPPAEIPVVKLKKVSSMPIAGFGIFNKERLKEIPITITETTDTTSTTPIKKVVATKKPIKPPTEFMPAVRYIGRAEGFIYQTFLDKIEEKKFSATVIPKVYEAFMGNKGMSVVMRYLKIDDRTIQTFVGVLPKEILGGDTTVSNEIKGSFLPDNITYASLSPDTTKIFYLFNTGDSVVGTTLNLLDNKKTQIFDSPFTEWLSSWPNSSMITLTTKPSWSLPGHMYTLNPSTKSLSRVLSNINGLTTLASPNGKLVLYSNNNLALNIYNISTKNSDLLGVRTLPEKCVWGKANDVIYCAVPKSTSGVEYPDIWYQGEVSFSDQIWKINVANGNTTMISDPANEVGGEEVDGIKLALDEKENYLLFVNKKNSILWELNLK